MPTSTLSPTQKYSAVALFSLALRHAQLDQTGTHHEEETEEPKPNLWTHASHGLLRPIFRIMEIDDKAWRGLEDQPVSDPEEDDHVATFLRIISEEDSSSSSKRLEQELVLTEAVDSMASKLEASSTPAKATEEKRHEYQNLTTLDMMHKSSEDKFQPAKELEALTTLNMMHKSSEDKFQPAKNFEVPVLRRKEQSDKSNRVCNELSKLRGIPVKYQRKVTLLFELLSACLSVTPHDTGDRTPIRKGYDARHRTALRLLATWLDVKWIKMEAIEIMVAFSAMAIEEEGAQSENNGSEDSTWSRWKQGGIIGAAALTGGTLMAITGGLAAPAIAAGFSALAPTLGTLVPVIGASGFAAAASAAGSVAGSVAVAASFGAAGAGLSGTKMARRIGCIEEFEFKTIGENHNQGHLAVGIVVSGFVFEDDDFIKPWERTYGNLERYALVWESKNLIAVSTAIQDWLTSRLTIELMKQGAMLTVLSTLVSALAWPAALLSATDFIDSKWSIAVDRSDKAGKLLAEVLSNNLQGNRHIADFFFLIQGPSKINCSCIWLLWIFQASDSIGVFTWSTSYIQVFATSV
ncbi:transmembrane and coiled-coil domain-containing protein 4-like [Iris pallida]|uniref:Transmembrane and coiled-coil domain-containing protein 4-like n=1 Tax=Iris pallida TaxID=29817 RepID=A0AAX6HIT8_IRIPA|nr:transmembrane and coiled-coil domain-containing protein 4-like [Iris pallida]